MFFISCLKKYNKQNQVMILLACVGSVKKLILILLLHHVICEGCWGH
jgi:NRPS condensation-like uncharacterized protein